MVALVTTVQPTTALSQSHTDPATSLHSSLITDKSICYSVNMTATHECGSDNELRGVCLSVCAPSFESLDLESRVVELAFENLGRLAQWSTF